MVIQKALPLCRKLDRVHPNGPTIKYGNGIQLNRLVGFDRLHGNELLEESGTCQLYSPDRAARIEWAL